MGRQLVYLHPFNLPLTGCRMVLCENDGTEVKTYVSDRSFLRIQRYGRWFRFSGLDNKTGELVYLPESELE